MTKHRLDNLVLSFFGFSRLPFSKNISSKEIFSTQTYKEAFTRLEFGISDEDIMLLTGPVGSGKSVVLGSLIDSIDLNSYIPIYIRGNNLKEGELYKAILIGLDQEPPRYSQTAKRLFYRLVPELTKKPVVIVDDAQEIHDPALTGIKSMVNFHFDSQNKITFILSGQPELKAKLKYSQFSALKQRIRVFFHMESMSLEESCGYIDHHTKIAGRPNAIFSDEAKSDIHRKAEGIPRRINAICYRSILNAALNELNIIDSSNLVLEDPTD